MARSEEENALRNAPRPRDRRQGRGPKQRRGPISRTAVRPSGAERMGGLAVRRPRRHSGRSEASARSVPDGAGPHQEGGEEGPADEGDDPVLLVQVREAAHREQRLLGGVGHHLVRLRLRRLPRELRAHLRQSRPGPVPRPESPQSESLRHPQYKRLGGEKTQHRVVN